MQEKPVVIVNGESLTIEDVVNAARLRSRVELSKGSVDRVERSRAALETVVGESKTIYGVTTGFGALSNTRITPDQATQLQTNLLRSHASGVGDNLSSDVVRALMLLRLNTLAKGLSGVRLVVAEMIQRFLNDRIHPVIPSRGSVGASGDLAPLSHMAITLMGEGTVEFHGKLRPASEVLHEVGLTSLSLTMKEGLALNNGTQMSTAVGALVVYDFEQLVKLAEISGAMSLEALQGLIQPFDARIHNARPHKGQIDSAQNLRTLLGDSKLVRAKIAGENESAQDAYSLRCIPQVVGAAREAVAFAHKIIETEINSATDNPLVFVEGSEVLSGGNFHGQPVGMAMDFVSIALATVANLSERRVFRLLDARVNRGLPPFLVGEEASEGLNSGLMALQYTAAALASENKVLAHPATVDTIPTSADMEDFVSMSATAALKAQEILRNAQSVVAIEFICSSQALDLRGSHKGGKGSRAAYRKIREKVPMLHQDRALSGDIEAVTEMIRDGSILEAVELDTGPLR